MFISFYFSNKFLLFSTVRALRWCVTVVHCVDTLCRCITGVTVRYDGALRWFITLVRYAVGDDVGYV